MVIALLATLNSLWATWNHVGDPQFDIHARLHFSREVFAALFAVGLATAIIFAPPEHRTRSSWAVMTVAIAAVAGGFWLSIAVTGAEVPGFVAAANHVTNSVFGLAAVVLSWQAFSGVEADREPVAAGG